MKGSFVVLQIALGCVSTEQPSILDDGDIKSAQTGDCFVAAENMIITAHSLILITLQPVRTSDRLLIHSVRFANILVIDD